LVQQYSGKMKYVNHQKGYFIKIKKGSIVVENEYQNKIVSRGQEYPILFNKLHLNSKFKLSQVIFNIFI